jgi:predicted amidophosphoribosyltransferase
MFKALKSKAKEFIIAFFREEPELCKDCQQPMSLGLCIPCEVAFKAKHDRERRALIVQDAMDDIYAYIRDNGKP